MADPDLELREGPGFVLLALPVFLSSVILVFYPNKGGTPPAPTPRSASGTLGLKN